MTEPLLKISHWDSHFENNRTRELKSLGWVPVPNKMDGDGYTELVDHEDGAAHLGAWLAIIEIASKCGPRGTLLREGGKPHDAHSLARVSRLRADVFTAVIPRLVRIGWLQQAHVKTDENSIPHESAAIPHQPAGKRLLNGMEWNRTEENLNPLNPPQAGEAEAIDSVSAGSAGRNASEIDAENVSDGEPEGFLRFWDEWPASRRKVDRASCLRVWKRRKLELIAETVIDSLPGWKASKDWREGFVPQPKTWLNQRRWEAATVEPGTANEEKKARFERISREVEESLK